MAATLLNLANTLVLPGWLLLIAAPRWKWTTRVTSAVVPTLLGIAYIVPIACNIRSMSGGFTRLEDIARLFEHPQVLLAGWLHYLAFDLFVGAWQVRDAGRSGMSHWLVVPCLLLTLMLGPTGLVAYYALRWIRQQPRAFTPLKRIAAELYRRSRPLTVVGASLLLGVLPLLLIAAAVDSRAVLGVNVWIKPIKFAASLGIYYLTLAWLLGHLGGPRWAVRTIAWVTAGATLFEAPLLVTQAWRAVPLHFNTTTSFDGALYLTTGAAACTQVALLAATLLLFCTTTVDLPRLYLYGIRAGMALLLLGMLPGFVMVAQGQHSVGVADGGAGLPLFNWSTIGGDLRIAHFFGLHALQVLPLAGYVLSRVQPVLGKWGLPLFTLFSAAYASALIGSFMQALSGHPLVGWSL